MSTDDDLYTPVLRLAHAGTSWHQQIGIPKALNGDGVLRHTIGNQFGLDGFGAANRETLVVSRCAGGIGVAVTSIRVYCTLVELSAASRMI